MLDDLITGTVKNHRFVNLGGGQTMLAGEIYGDKRNLFPDGTTIYTSPIEDIVGDVVTTKNSVYKLEKAS